MMGFELLGRSAWAARALWRICSTCSALTMMAPVWAAAAEAVNTNAEAKKSDFIGVSFDRGLSSFDAGRLARHIPVMTNPPLWKASVALTKAEAADVSAALELDGSAQAVLIVEEPFADGAMVEALYAEEPDAGYLSRIARRAVTVAPLPD